MTHIKIEGATMNKKVHECIRQNAPTAVTATKKHVGGVGYVFIIKDSSGKTVAQVSRISAGYSDGKWSRAHMLVTII